MLVVFGGGGVEHASARTQIINRGLCNHSLFTTHDYLSVFATASWTAERNSSSSSVPHRHIFCSPPPTTHSPPWILVAVLIN